MLWSVLKCRPFVVAGLTLALQIGQGTVRGVQRGSAVRAQTGADIHWSPGTDCQPSRRKCQTLSRLLRFGAAALAMIGTLRHGGLSLSPVGVC